MKTYPRTQKEKNKLLQKYKDIFNHPVWAVNQNTEIIVRDYSTSDFNREHYILDI